MYVLNTIVLDEALVGAPKTIRKIEFKDNAGYTSYVHFYRYFTGNCQLGAIAYANNFLTKISSDKDVKSLFNSLRNELGGQYPKQFLFDVQSSLAQLVRDYFQVVVDAPYISTNDSSMVLFIVKSPQ